MIRARLFPRAVCLRQSAARWKAFVRCASDEARSQVTGVAKNPYDGNKAGGATEVAVTEEEAIVPADAMSGAPEDLRGRIVRIYKPAKSSMQSGDWASHVWRLDWDVLEKGHRWENPLMGWASSSDYMQGTQMKFKTKEEAVYFCEKQGWDHYIQEPHVRQFQPKAYASQFQYVPGKMKHARTK